MQSCPVLALLPRSHFALVFVSSCLDFRQTELLWGQFFSSLKHRARLRVQCARRGKNEALMSPLPQQRRGFNQAQERHFHLNFPSFCGLKPALSNQFPLPLTPVVEFLFDFFFLFFLSFTWILALAQDRRRNGPKPSHTDPPTGCKVISVSRTPTGDLQWQLARLGVGLLSSPPTTAPLSQ